MNDQVFKSFSDVLTKMFDSMFTPLITIAVSLCAIWGVYLGFKYWRAAGDENKLKQAKSALVSFVIGIIVIFAVALAAPLLISSLVEFMSQYN